MKRLAGYCNQFWKPSLPITLRTYPPLLLFGKRRFFSSICIKKNCFEFWTSPTGERGPTVKRGPPSKPISSVQEKRKTFSSDIWHLLVGSLEENEKRKTFPLTFDTSFFSSFSWWKACRRMTRGKLLTPPPPSTDMVAGLEEKDNFWHRKGLLLLRWKTFFSSTILSIFTHKDISGKDIRIYKHWGHLVWSGGPPSPLPPA